MLFLLWIRILLWFSCSVVSFLLLHSKGTEVVPYPLGEPFSACRIGAALEFLGWGTALKRGEKITTAIFIPGDQVYWKGEVHFAGSLAVIQCAYLNFSLFQPVFSISSAGRLYKRKKKNQRNKTTHINEIGCIYQIVAHLEDGLRGVSLSYFQ